MGRLLQWEQFILEEGFLATERDLGGLGAVDNARGRLAAGRYAIAELFDFGDVSVMPAGDEV